MLVGRATCMRQLKGRIRGGVFHHRRHHHQQDHQHTSYILRQDVLTTQVRCRFLSTQSAMKEEIKHAQNVGDRQASSTPNINDMDTIPKMATKRAEPEDPQEVANREAAPVASSKTTAEEGEQQLGQENVETKEKERTDLLFECSSKSFFRLLAFGSLSQVTFWSSYSFLPTEMMSNPYMGPIGCGASLAFVMIARHFANHYVQEISLASPVAFRYHTHTFWGNKGPARIVQIGGNEKVQETSRYIAFKVKGETWYNLLDLKSGKFGSAPDAKDQLLRMLHGLRPSIHHSHNLDDATGSSSSQASGTSTVASTTDSRRNQSRDARRKGRRW